jgi:hypothetical protein
VTAITGSKEVEGNIRKPPMFCEYANGRCDQEFGSEVVSQGIFLYPNEPEIIASTIEVVNLEGF